MIINRMPIKLIIHFFYFFQMIHNIKILSFESYPNSMLKKIKPIVENDTIKVVHVQNFTVESTLYGMTEEEFIEKAQILPARTSKI